MLLVIIYCHFTANLLLEAALRDAGTTTKSVFFQGLDEIIGFGQDLTDLECPRRPFLIALGMDCFHVASGDEGHSDDGGHIVRFLGG